jgi:hypothetical protein
MAVNQPSTCPPLGQDTTKPGPVIFPIASNYRPCSPGPASMICAIALGVFCASPRNRTCPCRQLFATATACFLSLQKKQQIYRYSELMRMVYRWLLKRGPRPDCVLAGIDEPVTGKR